MAGTIFTDKLNFKFIATSNLIGQESFGVIQFQDCNILKNINYGLHQNRFRKINQGHPKDKKNYPMVDLRLFCFEYYDGRGSEMAAR